MDRINIRAAAFWVPFLATVGTATYVMADILIANGMQPLEMLILAIFVPAFSLNAYAFCNSIIGFLVQLLCRNPLAVLLAGLRSSDCHSLPQGRTAVVMPIYNEDPQQVAAGLEAVYRSLAASGGLSRFRFFILSDTRDDAIARQEIIALRRLRLRLGPEHLYYRRRTDNHRRKVGNLEDFCQRWGSDFDYMLVLDADSVMSGSTILQLVRLLDANPGVGLVQTVPTPTRQRSLFGRALQFAARLSSELLASGAVFWQRGCSNYFGHNAIIRLQPFMAHCQLPTLAGAPPFGGDVLSHDFIEAAYLIRAGYAVWTLPSAAGSYEELPGNLIDYAKRDQRWCQGNLQHLRFLTESGLRWTSRLHLLVGILAFVASPLWLLLISLGTVQLLVESTNTIDYFAAGPSLFPHWPVTKSTEAMSLLGVTIAMLLVPKLLATSLVLLSTAQRRAYGGGLRVVGSLLLEMLFSALLAPVMMLYHTRFVVANIQGRAVEWHAQCRQQRRLAWEDTARHLILPTGLGLTLSLLLVSFAPGSIAWLGLVLAGLILALPMAVLSSDEVLGEKLARWGWLLTPEELHPPTELQSSVRDADILDQEITRPLDPQVIPLPQRLPA